MDCDSSPSVLFLLFLPSPLCRSPRKGLLHCNRLFLQMVEFVLFFMKGELSFQILKTLLLLILLLSLEGSHERICSLVQMPQTDAGIFLYSDNTRDTDHRSQITDHRSQITDHKSQIKNHRSQITDHKSQITDHCSHQEIQTTSPNLMHET